MVQTILSVMLTVEKPFSDIPPVYLAILMTTMLSSQDKLRKLKQLLEEKFAKQIFANISEFSPLQQQRVVDFLGAYISQSSGKELQRSEPFLL